MTVVPAGRSSAPAILWRRKLKGWRRRRNVMVAIGVLFIFGLQLLLVYWVLPTVMKPDNSRHDSVSVLGAVQSSFQNAKQEGLEDRMEQQRLRLQALQQRLDNAAEHHEEQQKEAIHELVEFAKKEDSKIVNAKPSSHLRSRRGHGNATIPQATTMAALFRNAIVEQDRRVQLRGYKESMAHHFHGHILTCNDLFGKQQLRFLDPKSHVDNANSCIEHASLGWVACRIRDPMLIDTTKIIGSMGGEPMQQVLGRSEQEELLQFDAGTATLVLDHQGSNSTFFPFPNDFQKLSWSYERGMLEFLSTTVVQPSHQLSTELVTNTTTVLVRRGAYANPCMQILCLYNVYTLLQTFSVTKPNIVWLDGHAHGKLDEIWPVVFGTQPLHIKALPNSQLWKDTVVVNTLSAIGDEGFHKYIWRKSHTNTSHCDLDPRNNTLVAFRDHLLRQYGLERKPFHNRTFNNRLTLLIREDYQAHPRSNGRTDRVLANLTRAVDFLKSRHPEYTIHVVSFEHLSFREQLEHIVETDFLVAIHGAGNIHVLFLPNHATFHEYLPWAFKERKRFRFLSECLNLTYVAKKAWVVEQLEEDKVSVRIHPQTSMETKHDEWQEEGGSWH